MGNHGARVLTWLVPKLFPKSLDSKWIPAKLPRPHVEQFASGIVQPSLVLVMLTSPEIFLPLRKWNFIFLTAIIYWRFILELTNPLLLHCSLIIAVGWNIGLLPHPAVTLNFTLAFWDYSWVYPTKVHQGLRTSYEVLYC